VLIPLKTCNEAADHLIKWFGPEELERVVGGDRWWQVRGLDGIDAEWVAEEEDLAPDSDEFHKKDGKKLKDTDADILRMEKLESVMVCAATNYLLLAWLTREFSCMFMVVCGISTCCYYLITSRRRLFLGVNKSVFLLALLKLPEVAFKDTHRYQILHFGT